MEDLFLWIFEKIIIPLGMLFIILVILSIPLLIYSSYQEFKKCARYENKIVHQNAWTQYVWSGKVMIPIYHPAGDYYKNVCVEVKK